MSGEDRATVACSSDSPTRARRNGGGRRHRALALSPLLGAAAVTAALGGCGGSGSSSASSGAKPPPGATGPPTKLVGTVAQTGQVTLKTPKGAVVSQVPSGWYAVTVRDNATSAGFRLIGPGVNLLTKSTPGITLWGVDLSKGTYHYMSVGGVHPSVRTLTVS